MNAPERAARPWWRFGGHFAWAASLFLAGLGAKFGLILAKGFALAYHDQWQGEASELFMPYLTGKFTLATLCQPHNEHWIFFTRVFDLALLRLNGQWDSLLEMAANAVLHCAGVAAFGWVMASLLGKRSWLVLWPALALALAVPFAWENTLWGFQNQFYFLLIFSWVSVWLLGLNKPGSWRWRLGAVTTLSAVFTVASGFLAAAVIIALTALIALRQRKEWRQYLPTWIFCFAILVLGVVLKYCIPVDYNDQVHNPLDLLESLGRSLAWPWVNLPWYAPVSLFPLLLLAWMSLRSAEPPTRGEWMIFGVAIWAGLQALAGAFARGNGGVGPAWRYMDSLSFIAIANALAGYVLLTKYRPRLRFVPLLYTALACWALGCVVGIGFLTSRAWSKDVPESVYEKTVQTKAARAWVLTGDQHVFLEQPADMRIAPLAAWLMSEPHLRAVLPAGVREPLHIAPAQNTNNAFVRGGLPSSVADAPAETSWGSWSAQSAAARGIFESQPVRKSTLPYLEISVAGDLGAEGLSLELVDLNNGQVTEVRPKTTPGSAWEDVDVKAPAGEFKIVARDDSDTKWFAFKEPRELGRWSFWTVKLLNAWKIFIVFGVVGFLLNLASLFAKPAANGDSR